MRTDEAIDEAEVETPARAQAARRSTWVSVAVNIC